MKIEIEIDPDVIDPATARHVIGRMITRWPRDAVTPHLVNLISALRGWNPLEPGREMTVSMGDGEYVIKRTK